MTIERVTIPNLLDSQIFLSLFCGLDYTGIACMIMGSFVPCIYYGFYCEYYEKIAYCASMTILGSLTIIVALWDKFATPAFRPIRAGKSKCFDESNFYLTIRFYCFNNVIYYSDPEDSSLNNWVVIIKHKAPQTLYQKLTQTLYLLGLSVSV